MDIHKAECYFTIMAASLREKAADLRRQHILEAATRVFALRGFHRSTIREIAVEAGVADGTIYKAFENKTALLLALLDPLDEQISALDRIGQQLDAESFVRVMLQDAWLRFTPATLDALRTVLSEALVNAEFRAVYLERVIAPALSLPEPIFRALASANRIAPTEAALVTRALSSSIMGFVVLRLLGDPWVLARWDGIPDHLADLVLGGLLPAEGDDAKCASR